MTSPKTSFIEYLVRKHNLNIEHERQLWKSSNIDSDYVNQLFDIAYLEFGMTNHDLISSSRKADVIAVRHYMIYLLHQTGFLTLVSIAKKFGSRDHSTILYSKNRIADLLEIKDPRTIGTKARFDKHLNTITDAEKEKTL
jgi:chromosomal replication initiation ATPase DnaA